MAQQGLELPESEVQPSRRVELAEFVREFEQVEVVELELELEAQLLLELLELVQREPVEPVWSVRQVIGPVVS